jgi:uncharacterized protein
MSLVDRFVFDTSSLIGAVLRPQSVPRQAFRAALAEGVLCASPPTLDELEQVLMRDKFDVYQRKNARLEFFRQYRDAARLFPVAETDELSLPQPCRDRRDNKFLALARHCEADRVVSSDPDLLILNPWQGIPILRHAEFLFWQGPQGQSILEHAFPQQLAQAQYFSNAVDDPERFPPKDAAMAALVNDRRTSEHIEANLRLGNGGTAELSYDGKQGQMKERMEVYLEAQNRSSMR